VAAEAGHPSTADRQWGRRSASTGGRHRPRHRGTHGHRANRRMSSTRWPASDSSSPPVWCAARSGTVVRVPRCATEQLLSRPAGAGTRASLEGRPGSVDGPLLRSRCRHGLPPAGPPRPGDDESDHPGPAQREENRHQAQGPHDRPQARPVVKVGVEAHSVGAVESPVADEADQRARGAQGHHDADNPKQSPPWSESRPGPTPRHFTRML
jgi:hypothetical protein